MTIIRELISGLKASWHVGKGHGATRRGNYEKALRHYKLALEYEEQEGKFGDGLSPVKLECLARTYARLENFKEALLTAEKSRDLYKQLNLNNKLTADCIARVERLIILLKTGNADEIKKFLIPII